MSPERPLHPKEKVLEQALQWCKLPEPSAAYLLVRKVPIGEGSCLFTGKGSTQGPSGCPQRGTALPELSLALLTTAAIRGALPRPTVGSFCNLPHASPSHVSLMSPH